MSLDLALTYPNHCPTSYHVVISFRFLGYEDYPHLLLALKQALCLSVSIVSKHHLSIIKQLLSIFGFVLQTLVCTGR